MHEFAEPARAKINLTLRVHGRRADGYHEIESIVVFADAGDELRLAVRPSSTVQRPASLSVSGRFAPLIAGQNLVERALVLIERMAERMLPADVELDKRLPIASGIGGGSADAAAALRLIRRAFPELAPRIDWMAIARQLGADVPVCLDGRPALMAGAGETVTPLSLPKLDILLANAMEPVPADKTRRVFAALAAGPLSVGPSHRQTPASMDRATLLTVMRAVGNDLEQAAAAELPGVSGVKAAVAATIGCELAILSGAGPTIVGLYQTADAARTAAAALREAHHDWWIHAGSTAGA